jgi:hypothetical protein
LELHLDSEFEDLFQDLVFELCQLVAFIKVAFEDGFLQVNQDIASINIKLVDFFKTCKFIDKRISKKQKFSNLLKKSVFEERQFSLKKLILKHYLSYF